MKCFILSRRKSRQYRKGILYFYLSFFRRHFRNLWRTYGPNKNSFWAIFQRCILQRTAMLTTNTSLQRRTRELLFSDTEVMSSVSSTSYCKHTNTAPGRRNTRATLAAWPAASHAACRRKNRPWPPERTVPLPNYISHVTQASSCWFDYARLVVYYNTTVATQCHSYIEQSTATSSGPRQFRQTYRFPHNYTFLMHMNTNGVWLTHPWWWR
jgi:hypothetical protein